MAGIDRRNQAQISSEWTFSSVKALDNPPPYSETNQCYKLSEEAIRKINEHFENLSQSKDEEDRLFNVYHLIEELTNQTDKEIISGLRDSFSFGDPFDVEKYKVEIRKYFPQEENEQIKEALMKNEKMPECSEKRINQLLLYVEAMENKIEKLGGKEIKMNEFDNELELLFEQIGKEEPTVAEKFSRNFQELRRSRQIFDWKKMKRGLLEILKHWKVIDIGEILELIEKTNEASKSIEDQDILLLLGKTGAGKSTTIHYLTGSTFQKRTENGITYYTPVKCSPTLEKVKTSFQTKSETRYVTAIPVNFRDVGINKKGDIVICDTPGFDDTSGPEVDVANGIGLIRAISKSKSVRPVILMSGQGIGDRFEGLRDVAHTLIGMLPNIEDHLESVSYVFVKCSPEQRKSINGKLKDLKKNLNEEEQGDEAFCQLIEDMFLKTKKNMFYISLEGNGDDDDGEERSDLFRSLVSTTSISNPGDYFTSFVTEKSRGLIQQQANYHQNQILKASKRNNYRLVGYKLNELKSLCNTLETDEGVKRCYQESIQSLKEIIKSIYNNATINLGKCFDQENKLTQQDLQDYLDSYNILKSTSLVRDKHLGKDAVSSDALLLFLNFPVKQLILRISKLEFESKSQTLLKNLDKLKLISGFDSKFNSTNSLEYKKIQEHFKGAFESNIKKNKTLLMEDKISESSKIMDQIKDVSLHFTSHFDEAWLTSQYQQLIQDFKIHLDDITSTNLILEKKNVSEKDIETLISKTEKLEAIRNDISLKSHISIETIQDAQNKFINSIVNYFNGFFNTINSLLKQNGDDFKSIKSSIDQMILLRKIPGINEKTAETYHQSISLIFSIMDDLNTQMEGISQSLMSGDYIDGNKLKKILQLLFNSTWIKELDESNYLESLSKFQESLDFYLSKLEEKSKQIVKGFNLEGMRKILNQLPNVKNLENLVPTYSETRKKIVTQFEEKIKTRLTDIESLLLQDQNSDSEIFQLDFWKLQNSLSFLENLHEIFERQSENLIDGSILERASKISKDLKSFIEKSVSSSCQNIERLLRTIVDDTEVDINSISSKISPFVQLVREIKEKSNPNFLVIESIKGTDLAYLKDWNQKLVRLYDEVEESITILKDNDPSKLDSKLKVVKTLSEVDPIFLANGDSRSFSKLYQDNQRSKMIEHKEVAESVNQALQKGQFQQAAFALRTLKNNGAPLSTYNKCLNTLEFEVTNSCDEARQQCLSLRNFKEKQIKSLISIFTKIKNIERYLLEELPLEQKQQLKEAKKKIHETVIQKLCKTVSGIQESFRGYNFFEAEKQKDDINDVLETLSSNQVIDNFDQVDEEINKLDEYKKKIMMEIKNKYQTKPLDTYYLDPPKDIYEKLSKVKDKSEYRDLIFEFNNILVTRINEACNEAKEFNSEAESRKKFKLIESAIKTLPNDLQHHLQIELDHAKEDAKQISYPVKPEPKREEFKPKAQDRNSIRIDNMETLERLEEIKELENYNDIVIFSQLSNDDYRLAIDIDEIPPQFENQILNVMKSLLSLKAYIRHQETNLHKIIQVDFVSSPRGKKAFHDLIKILS